jgi:hypothetical protein
VSLQDPDEHVLLTESTGNYAPGQTGYGWSRYSRGTE